MKTVELTDREQTILVCLIGMEEIKRERENWEMDKKTDKFTKEEIERYDTNSQLLLELSVIRNKLKD